MSTEVTFPLPPSEVFGFSRLRVIHSIPDTKNDVDSLPEAKAGIGKVTIDPLNKQKKINDPVPAIVINEKTVVYLSSVEDANLWNAAHATDPDFMMMYPGEVIDTEGRPGFWAVAGRYRITFILENGQLDPIDTTIGPEHTLQSPNWISTDAPDKPGQGQTFITLKVPTGFRDGNYLGFENGVLVWEDGPSESASSALASAAAASTDRAATEAARDVALARVDVLEAPAKAFLDDIMGGDVEGVAALARNAVVEGGATKHSGTQNVRNLRRPVLAVDAMFPNGRSQDQIVWVDEKGGKAWGIGLDGGLRTASWNMSTLQSEAEADIGSFAYNNATYFETADRKFCVNGLFFVTEDGALLMDVMEGEVRTIQRSTKASGGFAWSPVITFDGEVRALGPQSMAQDPITKALYFVEYTSGSTRTHIDILKSTDDGATWQVFKAMPKSDVSANTIRHWHCVQWDAVSGRMHFSAGDGNPDAGIYRVNSAGTDIEPVFLNKNINLGAYAPYAARCVGMMFFPTHVAWGTDGTNGQELVIRIHRNQIGLPEPAYEIVAEVDNATWFTQQASDDGTMWLLSASTEYMPAATIAGDNGVSHLYAITDNGSAVDEIAAIAMRTSGPTSLSPICGPSGGATFWMRSHQYRESFAGISPLQFRARVGFGVVPLVKPRNIHQVVYSQESRNAVVELAAGETKTFGHTQSSKGIGNTLYMLNIGVKALSGTGVPKVQVWNGSTMLYEFSNISRRGSVGLAQEWIVRNPLSTYADIQFRVKETGGAACTASVFVEFGFGK